MSFENLEKRIRYFGGKNQQTRMNNDKLRTLKRALLYSYQAATAVLKDGKEFRCLINPDKNKPDYDNKILSIPYKDICLNLPMGGKASEGEIKTNIKTGDVFTWKQNQSKWLVFLQYLEETAYFRSEIRRCDTEIDLNGHKYWIYTRGPVETEIEWNKLKRTEWNSLNYSMIFYITSDEITQDYFNRFTKIKVPEPDGKEETWEVAGINKFYGDGIIKVYVKEQFNNPIQDAARKEKEESQELIPIDENSIYIKGPKEVLQYSNVEYTIENLSGGQWYIREQNGEETLMQDSSDSSIVLHFTGKIGGCTLIYRKLNMQDVTLFIKVTPI